MDEQKSKAPEVISIGAIQIETAIMMKDSSGEPRIPYIFRTTHTNNQTCDCEILAVSMEPGEEWAPTAVIHSYMMTRSTAKAAHERVRHMARKNGNEVIEEHSTDLNRI